VGWDRNDRITQHRNTLFLAFLITTGNIKLPVLANAENSLMPIAVMYATSIDKLLLLKLGWCYAKQKGSTSGFELAHHVVRNSCTLALARNVPRPCRMTLRMYNGMLLDFLCCSILSKPVSCIPIPAVCMRYDACSLLRPRKA
jgi:hypothetical protein